MGTIGEPGKRVFLLQARYLDDFVTLKVEKSQVAALAHHLGEILQGLSRPGHLEEPSQILTPYEIAWSVVSISISYDENDDRIYLLFEEHQAGDAEPSSLQIALSREQAAVIAIQSASLVAAGRPLCPLCGFPLDADGHACPKTNGHRAPSL